LCDFAKAQHNRHRIATSRAYINNGGDVINILNITKVEILLNLIVITRENDRDTANEEKKNQQAVAEAAQS
jgi:hypothetical protein